jgi:hypothetical protein
MSVGSLSSFFQQDQSFFSSNAATSGILNTTTVARLFGSAAVTSTSSANSTTAATDSMLGMFGTTLLHATLNANVLAAQEGSDRLNAKAQAANDGQPATSVPDVATQVTYSGTLAGQVNFGEAGPSSAGAYEFLTGSALQTEFKAAVGGLESNGSVVNQVSVSGDTLTASTSGLNAHPVFTLTLHPNSGLYTFTLLNPIDQKVSKLDESDTLDLSGLVQAVNGNGQTTGLTNALVIQVHNGQGDAKTTQFQVKNDAGNVTGLANAGEIFEGGLAYTGPDNPAPAPASTTTKPAKYTPPTNPLTGRPYAASAAAAAATFGAVNILT